MNYRITVLAALAPLALIACHPAEPWVPGLRRELTSEDYAVYSAWLAAQRPEARGTVLVDDRTTSTSYPGLSLVSREPVVCLPVIGTPSGLACPQPERAVVLASPPLPGDEASQDFRMQQEVSLPLERRLDGAVYDLVHDPVPEDLLSIARIVLVFSRVGFDSKVRVATLRVTQVGRGEWGWLGPVQYAVRAEKREGDWEVEEVRELGVGTPGPAGLDTVGTPAFPPPKVLPTCRSTRVRHIRICRFARP